MSLEGLSIKELHARWDLGSEMTAEGWMPSASHLLWFHGPSHRVVSISPRDCFKDDSAFRVICRVFDDLGNPSEEAGDYVETEPMALGDAIRFARSVRRSILESRKDMSFGAQLALFESEGDRS